MKQVYVGRASVTSHLQAGDEVEVSDPGSGNLVRATCTDAACSTRASRISPNTIPARCEGHIVSRDDLA